MEDLKITEILKTYKTNQTYKKSQNINNPHYAKWDLFFGGLRMPDA